MGSKMTENQKNLYKRIDEVIHYMWDPIGIAGTPEARDEYDAYIPQIFKLLIADKDEEEIVKLLRSIEIDRMGISTTKEKKEEISRILLSWKEYFQKE